MNRRLAFALGVVALLAGCSALVSYDGYGGGVRGDDAGGSDGPGTGEGDGDGVADGATDGPIVVDASDAQIDADAGDAGTKRYALVVLGGSLYATGSSTASVEYAEINADGTLGPFQDGPSMPMTESRIACAAWGSSIFVSDETGAAAAVMLPDGGMSTWATIPVIKREQTRMVAFEGSLYLLTGRSTSDIEVPEVFRATVTGPQSIGPWTAATPLPLDGGPRHESTLALDPVTRTLYVLGGDVQGVDMASVLSSRIDDAGALGPWTDRTPLAIVGDKVRAVVSGNHITILGGSYDVGSDREMHAAEILDGGALGPWTAGGTHPERDDPGHAGHRGFAYLVNGDQSGVDDPTVIVAPLNPATGFPGVWTTTSSTKLARHGLTAVVVELP